VNFRSRERTGPGAKKLGNNPLSRGRRRTGNKLKKEKENVKKERMEEREER